MLYKSDVLLILIVFAIAICFFAVVMSYTDDDPPVQPERYRACLIVKQDEVFCLSYERENQ